MISGLGAVAIAQGMCDSLMQFCFPSWGAWDVVKDHLPSSGAQTLPANPPVLEEISAIPSSGLGEHKHLFANEHPARPAPIPRFCQVDS